MRRAYPPRRGIPAGPRGGRPDAIGARSPDTSGMAFQKEDTMNTSKPILLATDGSPSAGEAQRQAFDLAKLPGAPLLVVSVSHATLPAMGYTAYGYSEMVTELNHAEHVRLDALLAQITAAAANEGIDCTTVAG